MSETNAESTAGAGTSALTREPPAWTRDVGLLVARSSIAVLMLFHGAAKLERGVGGIATSLGRKGLPGFIAYGAYIGEVFAPVLLVLGVLTRFAAASLAVNMIFAVWLVHSADVTRRGTTGGLFLELQALYFLGAVAVALAGPGRYSLSRGRMGWLA